MATVDTFSSLSLTTPSHRSHALGRKETGFLHFVKYHGLGDHFIMIDNRESLEPKITAEQVVKLCDRNFGIGAKGVIFSMPGINGADYTMRMIGSDDIETEWKQSAENSYVKEKLISARAGLFLL